MRSKVFGYVAFSVLLGHTLSTFAKTEYRVDSEKSVIHFEVSHMGFLTVERTFKEFSGKIIAKKTVNILEVIVESGSIWTDNQTRDNSLRQEAYLDVKKYPHIHFTAKKTVPDLDEKNIMGSLTIKETTQILEMPYVQIFNEEEGFQTLKVKTSIYRTDFGLAFGAMDKLVGNEIRLDIMLIAFLGKE